MMIKESIEVIGTQYKTEDMLVDLVEKVYGFTMYKGRYAYSVEEGCNFRDGRIVDCFEHAESDTVFIVVEYDGTFFCVYFYDYDKYELIDDDLPFR